MKPYLRNWTMLIFSDVAGYGFGFLSTILLTRNLNPEGYGRYNVLLAVSAMAAIVANFGMSQVLIREIARKQEISGALFRTVLPLRLLASAIAVMGVVIYFFFFSGDSADSLIIFTSLVTLCLTGWDLAESVSFGHNQMKFSATINSISTAAWFGILLIAPSEYYSVLNVLILFSVVNLVKVGVYYGCLRRGAFLAVTPGVDGPGRRDLVRMSLPYLWLWGLNTLSTQIPILLLARNSGNVEVGIFSVGARLIIPLMLLPGTATRALFPNLSKLAVENREKFQGVICNGSMFILYFGSIAAAVLSLCSFFLVPFLFGEAYRSAVVPFNLLIWYGVFYSADILLGAALSTSDRQNTLAVLATIDMVIALPILYYGSTQGASFLAAAKLATGIILYAYHWIVTKPLLGRYFGLRSWLSMGVFGVLVAFATLMPGAWPSGVRSVVVCLIAGLSLLVPGSPFRSIPGLIRSQLKRSATPQA